MVWLINYDFFTEVSGLRDATRIEILQDKMQEVLREYEHKVDRSKDVRFGRVLVINLLIGRLEKTWIEDLFFKPDISSVPVTSVLINSACN